MARLIGAKGGTIRVRVHSLDRAQEIMHLCDSRGWMLIAIIDNDQPEDTSNLEEAMAQPQSPDWSPTSEQPAPPPTATCPCGSGRRYWQCCLKR